MTELPSSPENISDPFLNRLKRLLRIRRDHLVELNEQGLRLLDGSIFGAYCDCLSIGQGQKARDILGGARKSTLDQPEISHQLKFNI